MKAPLCRLCNKEHWNSEPHQGLNPSKEEMRRARPATARPAPTTKPAEPCQALAVAGTKDPGSTLAKPKAPAGSTRKGTKKGREMIKRPPQADIERNVRTSSAIENTQREGHRVLKAEAERPDATRTASTEKPNPPPATQSTGKRGKPEKPAPGKRKAGPKGKEKR